MVHNHAVNRAISDALARLEERGKPIEHFTAHALRDTFATRYIEQGGNPQTLKTILGHNSLAMTMDLYSHVSSVIDTIPFKFRVKIGVELGYEKGRLFALPCPYRDRKSVV